MKTQQMMIDSPMRKGARSERLHVINITCTEFEAYQVMDILGPLEEDDLNTSSEIVRRIFNDVAEGCLMSGPVTGG